MVPSTKVSSLTIRCAVRAICDTWEGIGTSGSGAAIKETDSGRYFTVLWEEGVVL